MKNDSAESGYVQVEISLAKLEQLFQQGELCATELHCLDESSKQAIWNLCLSSCLKRSASNVHPLNLSTHTPYSKQA